MCVADNTSPTGSTSMQNACDITDNAGGPSHAPCTLTSTKLNCTSWQIRGVQSTFGMIFSVYVGMQISGTVLHTLCLKPELAVMVRTEPMSRWPTSASFSTRSDTTPSRDGKPHTSQPAAMGAS